VNPCGFPLLPAFLSFYLGADEQQLPRAATRVLQGLLVGALVTVGFVGLFALVSLPVSFGVALVARAVPWAGLATGTLLALAGLLVISGRRLPSASATGQPRSAARCRSSSLWSEHRQGETRSPSSSPTLQAQPSS
jgi:cytochrome c biogenesis protein CcdA